MRDERNSTCYLHLLAKMTDPHARQTAIIHVAFAHNLTKRLTTPTCACRRAGTARPCAAPARYLRHAQIRSFVSAACECLTVYVARPGHHQKATWTTSTPPKPTAHRSLKARATQNINTTRTPRESHQHTAGAASTPELSGTRSTKENPAHRQKATSTPATLPTRRNFQVHATQNSNAAQ
jgi:hypothetical protein